MGGPSASSVATGTRSRTEKMGGKGLGQGKGVSGKFDFGSSAPVPGVCPLPLHVVACLAPPRMMASR